MAGSDHGMPEQWRTDTAVVWGARDMSIDILSVGAGDIWETGEKGQREPSLGGGRAGVCSGGGDKAERRRAGDDDVTDRDGGNRRLRGGRRAGDRGSIAGVEGMLNDFKCGCPVYIACGYTDLRRGIDGLAGMVQAQQLTAQQYRWLMEGLSIEQPRAHRPVTGLRII